MVGNDVIDLGDPETRAGRLPRALRRARVRRRRARPARRERALRVRLRWILWAAKEAAYKVAKKRDAAHLLLAARASWCDRRATRRATVQHGGERYGVVLEVGRSHVHAVATADGERGERDDRVVARVERLARGSAVCPGSAARALAIATVAPLLGVAANDLAVESAGRVPRLAGAPGGFAVDLSLSHHGRFVAFACTLPAARAQAGRAS